MRAAVIVTTVFYGLDLIMGELARCVVEENMELEVRRILAEEFESQS